jgi:hypothetical protein
MRRATAGLLMLVLAMACGGAASDGSTEVVVRDSAGITIVEHPQGAVDAVPLMRPGEPVLSIGGVEADGDHDATFMTRAWLQGDGLLAINNRDVRFVRFDGQGQVVGTYGRRGDGPDEYQAVQALRLPGDSLLLIEMMRSNHRRLAPDLTTTEVIGFGEGPSFQNQIFGVTPEGTLLALRMDMEPPTERSGPASRLLQQITRLPAGATTWDTLMASPGELSYPTVFSEGGQEYPSRNHVTFGTYPYRAVWGDRLVLVDNTNWAIGLHGLDGALQREIRLHIPRRPVDAALRDSAYARDARQIERFGAQMPPAMREQALNQSRAQQFADSVAPYDRILTTRDGLLWMRINETPVDTTTTWLGFSSEGRLTRRLELPKRWMLLDADGEQTLLRRLDDDDIGYLEIRPMERIAP